MEPAGTNAKMAKRDAERLAEEDAARVQDRAEVGRAIEETDDLLADIDALLEEQEVLVNFRQKGGE
jgi:hypothetical protein